MKKLAFLDETLDLNLTKTYHISIQASLNGFSFCILDSIQSKYVALKYYPLKVNFPIEDWVKEIEGILEKDEFLSKEYKSCSFIQISTKATLIPSPLFDLSKLKLYLDFNNPIDDLDEIHYNKLKRTDAYNIFTINNYLATSLIRKFPAIKFYHQATPFIEHSLSGQNKTDERVYVNINNGFFDIAVIKNNKIILYNTFLFKSENDLLYYILYVYENLRLNTNKNELIISGFLARDSNYYDSIKNYIKNIRLDKTSDQFTYSYTFNSIETHQFLNLLNVYKCE